MKTLVKYQTYTMVLLAGVLFIVGTVISDDHTDISMEETQQMTKKPTIMILGTTHFANPGMDGINTKMDDVLAPKRQREIEQLVEQLKAFGPTKIALEVDFSRDAEINGYYQGYLKRIHELTRGEGDQIGFRLAKQTGTPKGVLCGSFSKHSGKSNASTVILIDHLIRTVVELLRRNIIKSIFSDRIREIQEKSHVIRMGQSGLNADTSL